MKSAAMFIVLFLLLILMGTTGCQSRITNPSDTIATNWSQNQQPPWPKAKVYTDANQKIIVNNGDELIIRFTMEYDLFPIIKEIYDTDLITLLDRKINLTDKQNQSPAYSWFLFKALKTGETQITIQHLLHISEALNNQETFTLVIN